VIGLIDWGIGGLGVARLLRSPLLYLSDTGSAPYGTLSARDLEARLRRAIAFLRARGASRILLACNAASTALPRLSDLENVSGVIAPTLALIVKNKRPKCVAIIGGRRTILSRVYANALRSRGFDVVQRIAQPLSGMIERGEQNTPRFAEAVANILHGITHYNALVLACTHYPAAFSIFEKQFPGAVIDPLPAIARACLESVGPSAPHTLRERDAFFTTGDPQAMQHAAAKAWGIEISARKAAI
jgi:glutamate racemase